MRGMDRTDKTRQDREPTGHCQLPNPTRVQDFSQMNWSAKGEFPLTSSPFSLSSQPFFNKNRNDKRKKAGKENNEKEETCIIFITDDSQ